MTVLAGHRGTDKGMVKSISVALTSVDMQHAVAGSWYDSTGSASRCVPTEPGCLSCLQWPTWSAEGREAFKFVRYDCSSFHPQRTSRQLSYLPGILASCRMVGRPEIGGTCTQSKAGQRDPPTIQSLPHGNGPCVSWEEPSLLVIWMLRRSMARCASDATGNAKPSVLIHTTTTPQP